MLRDPLDKTSILSWEADLVIDPAEANLPGVSIVIPIYNAGAFLEKTLRSLLCNDMRGIELILMDGGSSDNTADIVAHYKDIFAHITMERDEGQSDAINRGYEKASQPILYWLNGDDLILPNTLVAIRRAFRDNPDSQVVVGNAYMTEKDLSPIRHFVFSPEKLVFPYLLDYAAHHLIQPSVFFSRIAWDAIGPLNKDLHYAMDADLFLGMARDFNFLHLPLDIGYSVYHEDCKTRDKRGESITELALIQAQHGGFAQARKTLDILVSLFNDAEAKAELSESVPEPVPDTLADPVVAVLREKLKTLQNEMETNQSALLNLDMELT